MTRSSTRPLARFAGLIAGTAIALTLVLPAFAAPSTAAVRQLGDPLAAGAATDTGVARCAAAWLKAKADPTVENLGAVGDCEIDRRLATLDRLRALVADAPVITDAHETSLKGVLDGATTGLTALRAEIDAETSIPELRSEIRRIYTDFRVYVLDARQVLLVRGDDRVVAAADRLDKAAGQLADAIARAESNGKDVTEAKADLDAMTAAIAAARAEVAGDVDAVLAETPATWNAGTAKPILDAARASISKAQADLRTALRESRAVLAALR